jgi:NADPH:quinone reductase-like Zn-dependent oxidoreductase
MRLIVFQALELANLATELQELHLPPPHVGETFSFDDAPSALRRLQTGKTVGKVVLEVGDNCTTGLL